MPCRDRRARREPSSNRPWPPTHPVALANLGAFRLNEGNLPDAIRLLQQAVRINPYQVDALANLALAHYQSGRPVEAQQYARQTLQIDPNNAIARQIVAGP